MIYATAVGKKNELAFRWYHF